MLKIYLSLLLLFPAFLAEAQKKGIIPADTAITAREIYGFQEKVYLHTDKSNYSAGENIWFKIYRVDATNHNPNLYSRFVYVELINRQDSVIQRIKVMETDSCFYGNIKLDQNLQQGKYCIRAYSNWMQNNDPGFFFKKEITLFNPATFNVDPMVTYACNSDSVMTARVCFLDFEKKPYKQALIRYELFRKNKPLKDALKYTDAEGCLDVEIPANSSATDIAVEFYNGKPFAYKQTVHLPLFSSDFNCAFFPEGGSLLAGRKQTVAFKAIGNNGLSMEIRGEIRDDAGNLIETITSVHNGMGKFSLQPEAGKKYHADVTTETGLKRRFDLPLPREDDVAVSISNTDSVITCNLISTASFHYPERAKLLVHCRGRFIENIAIGRDTTLAFFSAAFPNGIIQFALVDHRGQVYSERIAFVLKEEAFPRLTAKPDKEAYGQREKVELSIRLEDNGNMPLSNALLSIAVTDSRSVPNDTAADNILSNLLLCSDLKGNIEKPGYYFDTQANKTERIQNLDLLMLTQGWKRFDIGKYVRGIYPENNHYLEITQYISGRVKTFSGKAAAGNTIVLYTSDNAFKWFTQTDNNGNFAFDNLIFPDSVSLAVKAFAQKENKRPEIMINPPRYAPITPNLFHTPHYLDRTASGEGQDVFTFYKTLKQNFYYDNGEKVYTLGEVTVQAGKKTGFARLSSAEGVPDQFSSIIDKGFNDEDIELSKFKTIDDILNSIPQLTSNLRGNGEVLFRHLRNRGENIEGNNVKGENIEGESLKTVVVDNMKQPIEYLLSIEPSDIKSIGFAKNAAALTFFRDPVIIVYLKEFDKRFKKKTEFNRAPVNAIGYHCPAQFYVPKYDIPEIKKATAADERNTVYWNPKLKTDVNGQCKTGFYTTDSNTPYRITMEGITRDGKAFRYTSVIVRD